MKTPEYFVNGTIWGIAAVLVSWGLAAGTLTWLDATLIMALVAWPLTTFYCLRFDGLFGFLMKAYVVAFPVAIYFWFF